MKNNIIVVLSALVVALAGYMLYESFNSGMSKAEVQTEFNDLKSDYEGLQIDLEKNLHTLGISNKVINAQKQKLKTLMHKNALTEEELAVAKKLMAEISQNVLQEYHKRVGHLETEKVKLQTQNVSDEKKLQELTKKVKALENSNQIISDKYALEKLESLKKDNLISYATKLSVSNFVLKGIKVKNSGKEIETDRASRITKLQSSFDINENKLVESGKKELFLAVYQPDGSLAKFSNKQQGSFIINGQHKIFSDRAVVDYVKGSSKTISFDWEAEDFKRGDYILEVYEKTKAGIQNIGKATKTLD